MKIFNLFNCMGMSKKEIMKYLLIWTICAIVAGIVPPILVDVYARFIDEIISIVLVRNISKRVIEIFVFLVLLKFIEQIPIIIFPYIQELLSIVVESFLYTLNRSRD